MVLFNFESMVHGQSMTNREGVSSRHNEIAEGFEANLQWAACPREGGAFRPSRNQSAQHVKVSVREGKRGKEKEVG